MSNTLKPQRPDVSKARALQVASCTGAALDYLNKGCSVIPIGSATKKPLIAWEEFKTRLPTEREVREWYGKYPNVGVAIITGKVSNLITFDVDPRNGGNPEPFKKYQTAESKTGGGGNHFFFKYPDFGVPTIPSILPGVDLKSDRAYVIAPPSIHPSGNPYVWEKHIFNNLPTLPQELTNLILEHKNKKSSFDISILDGVSEGSRNESATSLIGKLIRGHREEDWEVVDWELLKLWNQYKNDPPLLERELYRSFKSICSKELQRRFDNSISPEIFPGKEPVETNFELKIQPWNEFVDQQFEEPEWIVEDLIPKKGLVAVAGPPESLKSLFTEYLAIKVSLGEIVLGKFRSTKTPVLIIDQENIRTWLYKRLTQLSKDRDLPIHIYDKDKAIFNLLDNSAFNEISDYVDKHNIGLVIVDTLRLAHDKEENSSTEMKQVVEKLKQLTSKTAVAFIHHHRKADKRSKGRVTGEDMMGSMLIRGVVDYQLTLTNLGEQEDGTHKVRVQQSKSRYTRTIKSFEMALEESDGTITFVYKGEAEDEKLKKEEAKVAILGLLQEQDWKRQEIIDQLVSDKVCGSRTAEDGLKELTGELKVKHTATKPHIYSLVKDTEVNIPHPASTYIDHGIAESSNTDPEQKLLQLGIDPNKTSDQLTNQELLKIFPGAKIEELP